MLNMIKSNYSPRFIQALHLLTKIFSELEFFISNGMLFQMIAPEYVKLFLNKLSFGLGTKKFLLATERKLEIVSSGNSIIKENYKPSTMVPCGIFEIRISTIFVKYWAPYILNTKSNFTLFIRK